MFALIASFTLAGCGMLPPLLERTPTVALKAAPDSELVKIAERSRPAPELTGFRLMPLGSYALDTRVQLAKRVKHSLDVQYYLIQNDMTGRLLMRLPGNEAIARWPIGTRLGIAVGSADAVAFPRASS